MQPRIGGTEVPTAGEGVSQAAIPMVVIPGGAIVLRDERTKRMWKVHIQPFLLARYPVTGELYSMVTGESRASCSGDQRPVTNVSWSDALHFCNLLSQKSGLQECYPAVDDAVDAVCDWEAGGYRLPSEAEWEYACRAGTADVRYGELDRVAWYCGNSGGESHAVGQKEPNSWGLYDMIGNVWEWCWDLYDVEVYGSYRVFRGGGWNDPANGCRASCRRRSHPSYSIDDVGFRLARRLPEEGAACHTTLWQ